MHREGAEVSSGARPLREVIVADNGSEDASPSLAAELGARVVVVVERGYGNALRGGIAAARGRFVVMGDADDSYDFAALGAFIEKLRAGADLVQGCRLPAGEESSLPRRCRRPIAGSATRFSRRLRGGCSVCR